MASRIKEARKIIERYGGREAVLSDPNRLYEVVHALNKNHGRSVIAKGLDIAEWYVRRILREGLKAAEEFARKFVLGKVEEPGSRRERLEVQHELAEIYEAIRQALSDDAKLKRILQSRRDLVEEIAYLQGMVGDLHVQTIKMEIVVEFGTSRESGLKWIYTTFREYGLKPILVFENQNLKPRIRVYASLELKELFEDAKEGVPRWILKAVELGFEDVGWAYIAGAIDAEGSIYVSKIRGSYELSISIASINERLIDQLIELLKTLRVEAYKARYVKERGKARLYVEIEEEVRVEEVEEIEKSPAEDKRVWFVLYIKRREDVERALSNVFKHLEEPFKRDRAETVLEYVRSGKDLRELYERFVNGDLSVVRQRYSWPRFIDELLNSPELRRELGISEGYAKYLALCFAIHVIASLLNGEILEELRRQGKNPPISYYFGWALSTIFDVGDLRLFDLVYDELQRHGKGWRRYYDMAYKFLKHSSEDLNRIAFTIISVNGRRYFLPKSGGRFVASGGGALRLTEGLRAVGIYVEPTDGELRLDLGTLMLAEERGLGVELVVSSFEGLKSVRPSELLPWRELIALDKLARQAGEDCEGGLSEQARRRARARRQVRRGASKCKSPPR